MEHRMGVTRDDYAAYRDGRLTFSFSPDVTSWQCGDVLTMRTSPSHPAALRFEITNVQTLTFTFPLPNTDAATEAFAGHCASLRRLPDEDGGT